MDEKVCVTRFDLTSCRQYRNGKSREQVHKDLREHVKQVHAQLVVPLPSQDNAIQQPHAANHIGTKDFIVGPSALPSSVDIGFETRNDFIWQELRAELFELFVNVLGEEFGPQLILPLREWRHVIRATISLLQVKEQQYRRLPRQAIERLLDELLPSAESGRSFVQFLLGELSRLRAGEGYGPYTHGYSYSTPRMIGEKEAQPMAADKVQQTNLRDRALRIIVYTIKELAEQKIIPIPVVRMLDDKKIEEELETQNTESPPPNQGSEKQKHTQDETKIPILEPTTKHDKIVQYCVQIFKAHCKRTYFPGEKTERKSKMSWIENFLVIRPPNSATFQPSDVNQRYYGARGSYYNNRYNSHNNRYSAHTSGMRSYASQEENAVGPVQLNLPFYRNPTEKIQQLNERRADLVERFERLQNIESLFESLEDKRATSIAVAFELATIRKQQQTIALANGLLTPPTQSTVDGEVIPLKKLPRMYDKMFKRASIKYIQDTRRKKGLLPEKKYPPFLVQFATLSKQDIEGFVSKASPTALQQQQHVLWSKYFLSVIHDQLGLSSQQQQQKKLTLDYFRQLISRDGPLFTLEPVQHLLKFVVEHTPKKDLPEEELAIILYDWVVAGKDPFHLDEKASQTQGKSSELLQKLLNQVVLFVTNHESDGGSNTEQKLLYLEECCFEQIIYLSKTHTHQHKRLSLVAPGYYFLLEFVQTLRDTIQYELQQMKDNKQQATVASPTTTRLIKSELPHEQLYEQQQQILRQGAFKFLSLALDDKNLSPQSGEDRVKCMQDEQYKQTMKHLFDKQLPRTVTTGNNADEYSNTATLMGNEQEEYMRLLLRLEQEQRRYAENRYRYHKQRLHGTPLYEPGVEQEDPLRVEVSSSKITRRKRLELLQ